MKTKIKRVVSLLIASLMLFGSFQVSVFADEGGSPPVEESQAAGADNENNGEENGSVSEKAEEDVTEEPSSIPDGRTTALDQKTGTHNMLAEKKAVIVDTVVYKNLIPGKKYTVTGILMDKETKKALIVNGGKVTATKTFKADKPDGEIQIEFKLDASAIAGKSVVAFETVTYEGKEVFTHADLNDEDQTVEII